ncbi:hypothetical protein TSUD_139270 [Trifolium subterraneum]|uniref:LOB domain-containing protein n=1 Tax=Trifolium subterraneum TaxID=3900 RepID=A0A2Z6NIF0_TRISU|nr:hypothetical protein TSUD_139270 [Trifolium subterraneum]
MAGATQEVVVTVPCGVCKYLKKCTSECIFTPYFDTEQGATSFAAVHKVFGASNVSKLLSNISINHRHEAAVTISYEAQARLSDPVYGCGHHSCFACSSRLSGCNASRSLNDAISADESEICIFKCYSNHTPEAASNTTATKLQCICAPAFSNNSSAATNNFMNMNNFTLVLTSQ